MIEFKPIDLERDYQYLCGWWMGHGVQAVPREILPDGWIAFVGTRMLAASFLYSHKGKIGVIEWTTTNPAAGLSRDLLEAVKGLYAHLEGMALAEGCICVISFVKPRSSEERIMEKMGYVTSADDCGHRLFAKPLNAPNFVVPTGGMVPCR